ncbi:MAG: hypothetical protein ACFB20_05495 [Opitutales bacterium]
MDSGRLGRDLEETLRTETRHVDFDLIDAGAQIGHVLAEVGAEHRRIQRREDCALAVNPGHGTVAWAEIQLAALGFDFRTPQPDLVATYFANASLNGLFAVDQLRGLAFEAPVLTYNPQIGKFTITLRLRKSDDLNIPNNFQDFDFNLPDIRVNANGELEFDFESAEDAAFFILEGF